MIWVAVIVIGILVLVFATKGEKEECPECEEPEEEPCAELKKLAILYKGKYLVSQEVVEVSYNTPVVFEVQGFDVTGTKEACIDGNQVMWLKGCDVVHWTNSNGLVNSVLVNDNTKDTPREVWVKYSNGLTFIWKVKVV